MIEYKTKPIISYWRSGDPCYQIERLKNLLTEINIINTKHLSDEFISFCVENKDKLYLHLNITGMGKTKFEPNIPTVKETFFQLKKLITLGFNEKKILVCVNPILPNVNGLKALQLLLRIFSEFKELRLRFIRFNVLSYRLDEKSNRMIIANNNINKRQSLKAVLNYLNNEPFFWKDYYKLIDEYKSIIVVDKGEEALIGIRELISFGLKNDWVDENNNHSKIIYYEKGNRHKPKLNIISDNIAKRCKNKCLLCPFLY
jgi:hypothetical protein